MPPRLRAIIAELLGTLVLATVVVGSGLQGPALGSEPGSSLLINVVATALTLWLLITFIAPTSGAHLNPAVTLFALWRRSLGVGQAASYLMAQLAGAFIGVFLANVMYSEVAFTWSNNLRANWGTGVAELVATTGLLVVVAVLGARGIPVAAVGVAGYIGAAALATSSTAFANPALSLARIFAADGSGIDPGSALVFVAVELAAVPVAILALKFFESETKESKND